MALKLNEVIRIIENAAPADYALSYDNPGLAYGDYDKKIENILIALDITEDVTDEAIRKNCQLILTHHPLLFKGADSITADTAKGRKIIKLIRKDIAAYSAHTNLDAAPSGLNDMLVEKLGLKSLEHMEGSIGRIADIEEIKLSDLILLIKDRLGIRHLRYSGNKDWKIKRVGIINGAGADMTGEMELAGCDAVITGDVKYHEALDAYENGTAVIDAGHFGTEWEIFRDKIHELLGNEDINLIDSELMEDIFIFD